MSSREHLAEVAHRWIGLWTFPTNWEEFESLHSEAFIDGSPAGRGDSKADYAQGLREFAQAFPDFCAQVEQLIIDDKTDRVAIHWSATGTNVERFLEVGPTNRLTTITGIEVIQVFDRQINARWGEWDISDHLR